MGSRRRLGQIDGGSRGIGLSGLLCDILIDVSGWKQSREKRSIYSPCSAEACGGSLEASIE